jgi:hypothetical protein
VGFKQLVGAMTCEALGLFGGTGFTAICQGAPGYAISAQNHNEKIRRRCYAFLDYAAGYGDRGPKLRLQALASKVSHWPAASAGGGISDWINVVLAELRCARQAASMRSGSRLIKASM